MFLCWSVGCVVSVGLFMVVLVIVVCISLGSVFMCFAVCIGLLICWCLTCQWVGRLGFCFIERAMSLLLLVVSDSPSKIAKRGAC